MRKRTILTCKGDIFCSGAVRPTWTRLSRTSSEQPGWILGMPGRGWDWRNAVVAMYYAGLQDEAIRVFRTALELNPEMDITHSMLGRVYLARSQPHEALAEMEKENHPALRVFGLALAYHALGNNDRSEASL